MEGLGKRRTEAACWTLPRREILGWSLLTAVLATYARGGVPTARAARGSVYVFPLVDIRPHALQKLMESALPNVEVTVFGRVGDFKSALDAARPDAVIALAPVLEHLSQTPVLQGVLGGSRDEKYLLVSERPLDASALASMTIGCVDLVGRRELPAFAAKVLGLKTEPEVERVTKVEDLLRLLQFQRADGVLLPERFLESLKARTKMNINVLDLPSARVRRTAIGFPGDRASVEAALRSLPREVNDKLGVDGWL